MLGNYHHLYIPNFFIILNIKSVPLTKTPPFFPPPYFWSKISYWAAVDQGQLCFLSFGAAASVYTLFKTKELWEGRDQCESRGAEEEHSLSYLHTGQDVFYILSHVTGLRLIVIPYPLGRCLQFWFQYWLGIMQRGKINNYAIPQCTQTHSQELTALWVK